MRTSLLTRVIFAFCLVASAAGALVWTNLAMQQRIMGRYDATQSTDISSLRDVREAQRAVVDYRNLILSDSSADLTRALRLSTALAPIEDKIGGVLERIASREPSEEPFAERRALRAPLDDRLRDVREPLAGLPRERTALLQSLDAQTPDAPAVQRHIGATLVSLDTLEEALSRLSALLHQRHIESSERLARDQRLADRLTLALLGLALLAFLVASGTVWSALRPIQRLTQAATAVGRGDFQIEPVRAGRDEVGQLAEAFFQMTQDLSERDEELRRTNIDLEVAYENLLREEQARIQAERLSVVGELSARITHELRNPLSSLTLNVEMILDDPALTDLDEDSIEMLRAMKREIQRLEELSSGYLSLTRKPTGTHAPLALASLVTAVLTHFRRSAELDAIELRAALNTVPHIDGDENELRQVLINLIENARIALKDREAPRVLRITLELDGDDVLLLVEDNGEGVSAEMEEVLFEPFSTSRREGTGLGLSTSRRIAQHHGGTLSYARSALGGAAFTLRLPTHVGPSSDDA